jgi:peroxiredoxin
VKAFSVIAMGAMLGASLVAQQIQPPKTQLKEGDMAPDFSLRSTAGGTVKLSDFRGKNMVVLAFYPAAFTGG